jgi:hypothetical protein
MTSENDADDAALAPFFAAAQADAPELPTRLLNAMLADAADVAAVRPRPAPAAPPTPWWRRIRPFEPIGGWRGLAALGACAALGFWIGIAGGVTVEGGTVWAGSGSTVSEVATDPVGEFFDLASAEN